jgi:hypothetical protein
MRKFLSAVVFVTAGAAGHAEGPLLPLYDVDGKCAKLIDTPRVASGFSGPPVYIPTPKGIERTNAIRECVFLEQRVYDTLKSTWGGILPVTKNRCIAIASKNPSYQMLENCIEVRYQHDVDAADRAAQGSFRP